MSVPSLDEFLKDLIVKFESCTIELDTQILDSHTQFASFIRRYISGEMASAAIVSHEDKIISSVESDIQAFSDYLDMRASQIGNILEEHAARSSPSFTFIAEYKTALEQQLRSLEGQKRDRQQLKGAIDSFLEPIISRKRVSCSVISDISEIEHAQTDCHEWDELDQDKTTEQVIILQDGRCLIDYLDSVHSCGVKWSHFAGTFSSKQELSRDIYCGRCRRKFRIVWRHDDAVTKARKFQGKNVPSRFFASPLLDNIECSIFARSQRAQK